MPPLMGKVPDRVLGAGPDRKGAAGFGNFGPDLVPQWSHCQGKEAKLTSNGELVQELHSTPRRRIIRHVGSFLLPARLLTAYQCNLKPSLLGTRSL
jgi:hypothetical protein